MESLCAQSSLWQKISAKLKERDSINPFLPLKCQVHSDQTTKAICTADFPAEGGCTKVSMAHSGCMDRSNLKKKSDPAIIAIISLIFP
jgi:hypothetical protein